MQTSENASTRILRECPRAGKRHRTDATGGGVEPGPDGRPRGHLSRTLSAPFAGIRHTRHYLENMAMWGRRVGRPGAARRSACAPLSREVVDVSGARAFPDFQRPKGLDGVGLWDDDFGQAPDSNKGLLGGDRSPSDGGRPSTITRLAGPHEEKR